MVFLHPSNQPRAYFFALNDVIYCLCWTKQKFWQWHYLNVDWMQFLKLLPKNGASQDFQSCRLISSCRQCNALECFSLLAWKCSMTTLKFKSAILSMLWTCGVQYGILTVPPNRLLWAKLEFNWSRIDSMGMQLELINISLLLHVCFW